MSTHPTWVGRRCVEKLLTGGILLLALFAQAQVHVTFPSARIVVQRNEQNGAFMPIMGTCPPGTDRIDVLFTVIGSGQGQSFNEYIPLQDAVMTDGLFTGGVTVQGGWYHVDVRAMQGGTVLNTTRVTPVGVGEVFVIAGQSNARGLLNSEAVGAADDRVNCVAFENWANDTLRLPMPPPFSQMTAETFIGPTGRSAWCWGRLGDLLAARLNVPVLFYNTAMAALAIRNFRESIEHDSTRYTFGDPIPRGVPYGQLRRVLLDYVPLTGARAVLWHQGESEAYDTQPGPPNGPPGSAQNYVADLTFLINRVRAETGHPLAWVVARASIDNNIAHLIGDMRYWPVINAQNQVIQTTQNVFYGPDTDPIQFPRTAAGSGVHFYGPGLIDLANAWHTSLTDQFFGSAPPLLPRFTRPVDLRLTMQVGNRAPVVGQPVGVSLTVANESDFPAQAIRVQSVLPPNMEFVGGSSVAYRDGAVAATIPTLAPRQSVTLGYQVRPVAPGHYRTAAELIGTAGLDPDSQPGSGLSDGQDDAVWEDFRTREPSTAEFVPAPRPNVPPAPPVQPNQPPADPMRADLSLQLVTDRITTILGQPFGLTIAVSNAGGQAATQAEINVQLSPGLTFVSSPNVGLNGSEAVGTLTNLAPGATAYLWLTVAANQSGVATVAAQIRQATPADPDSTAANGYANGEDDTDRIWLRVRE